jgi:hypothetical protein
MILLPPHIAEHSPRDLEWGCVDSVLALARGMFGNRAECERRCVWCRLFCSASKDARVPTRGNTSDPTTHREPLSHLWVQSEHLLSLEWQASGVIAMCGRVHRPWMLGESFVVESRRVRSAMCGGSMSTLSTHPHSRSRGECSAMCGGSISCWLELSAVQLSEVTWSSWLLSERVQLSGVSWKWACEEKSRWLVWNGRQPGTQLDEGWQFNGILYGMLWRKELVARVQMWK